MILSPQQQSVSRNPRAIVTINDIYMKWVDIMIDTTTFYIADNFRVTLPLQQDINFLDLNYWASASQFAVKIYVGFPQNPEFYTTNDLELLMFGDADDINLDLLTATITLSGRDLTSRLIDNKTTEKYSNLTASQIATQLAILRGLTPEVTETKNKVGIFYQNEQTLLSDESTEWDLLTFLAQQEGFVTYVEKDKLIFKPEPTEKDIPYILNYKPRSLLNSSPSFPGMTLNLSRSTTLAQDVTVTVRVPFSTKSKKSFNVTVSSTHQNRSYVKGLPKSSSKKQKYVYTIPGLTKEQALQRAQQLLRNITVHEVNLMATMPADNSLKKDSLIKLQGTNSSFDQFYFADNVVRTMSMKDGYNMEIHAKNHSVDSQINL